MTQDVRMSRKILTSRCNSQGKTFSYRGTGYTYHLHKNDKDIWVKVQMARDKMKSFVDWCWKNARSSFKVIDVCHQGAGGWFDIFTMEDSKLFAVIAFVKNLNKWMHGAFTQAVVKTRRHYFIEVRKFIHTPPRQQAITPISSRPPERYIPFDSVLNSAPTFARLGKLQMIGMRG